MKPFPPIIIPNQPYSVITYSKFYTTKNHLSVAIYMDYYCFLMKSKYGLPRFWIHSNPTWIVYPTCKQCLSGATINLCHFDSLKDVISPINHTTFPFNGQSVHLTQVVSYNYLGGNKRLYIRDKTNLTVLKYSRNISRNSEKMVRHYEV